MTTIDTDYARDDIKSPHVQIERRQVKTGQVKIISNFVGGAEWYAQIRILLDGQPVSDWHNVPSKSGVDFDSEYDPYEHAIEDASHPDVTAHTVQSARDRAKKMFEESDDARMVPWAGKSGLGKRGVTRWILG